MILFIGMEETVVEADGVEQCSALGEGDHAPVVLEESDGEKIRPMLDEEDEEEYKLYQAKISEEIAEAAKIKAKLLLEQSNYTNTSQSVSNAKKEGEQPNKRPDSLNIDSLLRLFKSDFFDSWIGISYLFRYTSPGVHDYLCNQLYTMPDEDIEFYLIELW